MKVAYLIVGMDVGKINGVNKKILSTIREWKKQGKDVRLVNICKSPKQIHPDFKDLEGNILNVFIKSNVERLFSKTLFKEVYQWNPDVIYVRGIQYGAPFFKLYRDFTVIQEMNTNDLMEMRKFFIESMKSFNFKKIISAGMYLSLRNTSLKKITGFVLLNHELKKIIPYNKPYTVVGDGIDLNKYRLIERENKIKEHKDIVFMCTATHEWYGLDKLFDIAKKNNMHKFHIIGLKKENVTYKEIPSNIEFHGFLPEKEYKEILLTCDVAIASLSLHVIGMTEGSPLKVREYLAYRLPVITGFFDTDFMHRKDMFMLQLPSKENNVHENEEKIKDFIANSDQLKVNLKDIEHLDYEYKESKRLQFFEEVNCKKMV
ncbi:glycosyltransferase [Bacillus cereus group sp. N14]|uniref:glycosyltransferase n=1 Tax=Bacillus cereus group sp. N14 TaxID=2794587 RepID=UPI0018F38EE1|nr:glycosyltransferase [Bacillus cereus group sp. N14]MBJ8082913.1 glycosyltransferase [Bacillus cereus group sp. N14]